MLLCVAVLCFIRFDRFKDANTCSLTVCIKHTLNKFLGSVWAKQNYEGCYSTWHPFCFQGNLMYDHISLIEPKKCIWHLLVSICYSFSVKFTQHYFIISYKFLFYETGGVRYEERIGNKSLILHFSKMWIKPLHEISRNRKLKWNILTRMAEQKMCTKCSGFRSRIYLPKLQVLA